MKRSILLLVSVLFSGLALADGLALQVSNETVNLSYSTDLTDKLSVDINGLSGSDDYYSVSAGVYAKGKNEEINTEGKVGFRAFAMHLDNDAFTTFGNVGENVSGYGLTIGGELNYLITDNLTIGGYAYYAPGVLSGGDFDSYLDSQAKVSYQIFPAAKVMAGYHSVRVEALDSSGFNAHETTFVGFQLDF